MGYILQNPVPQRAYVNVLNVISALCALIVIWGCADRCKKVAFPSADNAPPLETTILWSGDVPRIAAKRCIVYEYGGEIESYAALSRISEGTVCFESRISLPDPENSVEKELAGKGFSMFNPRLNISGTCVKLRDDGTVFMVSEVHAAYRPRIPPGSTVDGLELRQQPQGSDRFVVVHGVMCFSTGGVQITPGDNLELTLTMPRMEHSFCWSFSK